MNDKVKLSFIMYAVQTSDNIEEKDKEELLDFLEKIKQVKL